MIEYKKLSITTARISPRDELLTIFNNVSSQPRMLGIRKMKEFQTRVQRILVSDAVCSGFARKKKNVRRRTQRERMT